MAVRIMSDADLARFQVIRDLDAGRLPARAVASILGVTERQVWRLLRAFQATGADGLISKKRGRTSNRVTPSEVRQSVMEIVKAHYADFGPTLAAEKLREVHGITLSRETVRAWLIEEGLWITRRQRLPKVHQPRYRRDCVGELVQIDGSEHRWFEDRGPMCTLLVFIDDATSQLMHLQFVETESTFSYFSATKSYLEQHGKPIAFYSDKHCVFRVAKPGVQGDGMTQFGRALSRLNIDIICANSSQAKGRVERANKTLQDRLVKEMRLKMLKYPSALLQWTVSASLPGRANCLLWSAQSAVGKRVTVVDYPDGKIAIRYKGVDLTYRTFDKIRKVNQAAVIENKRLGPLLEMLKAHQDSQPQPKRSRSAPKRRDQTGHMFSVD